MLLDEPTAGMTHAESSASRRSSSASPPIARLLMVEHNLSVVSACRIASPCCSGARSCEGDYDVSKDPNVVEAYLGKGI